MSREIDQPTGASPEDGPEEIPVGIEADETRDVATATDDAALAADDEALAEAGLPAEGPETPATTIRAPARRGSLAHRLYNGEAGLDVVGRSRLIYRITAVVVLICLASMVFRGFNFGIDFAGGNSFRLPGSSEQLTDVREAAEDTGAEVATAQVVGSNTILLRTESLDNDGERQVIDAVADAAGVEPNEVSPQSVSAQWGNDITEKAVLALVVFLAAVVAFLALRFQPTMAIGAMASLVHDIVLTAGVYSLIGFEVTPSTVIGFLTILGFSLYDTVVVFDKVEENTKGLSASARMTWGEAANLAVNQTLMRSINTSVIALLPVAGLLFVGAGLLGVGTLEDLALVLFVGLAAGTYSSIFLATPIVADLKEREPDQIALRKRVLARRAAATRESAMHGSGPGRAPVASARRGAASRRTTAVGATEREADLGPAEAHVVVESPDSVRREESGRPDPGRGGTSTPRPGARPQRPGQRQGSHGSGKKRR